jgi:hypothetical protein
VKWKESCSHFVVSNCLFLSPLLPSPLRPADNRGNQALMHFKIEVTACISRLRVVRNVTLFSRVCNRRRFERSHSLYLQGDLSKRLELHAKRRRSNISEGWTSGLTHSTQKNSPFCCFPTLYGVRSFCAI